MLFETKSEVDIHEMSPLALAFVGDAVLELLVRARLVGTTRLQPNRLHTVATHYVSAHAQNLELAVIEPMLTDAEAAVLRAGAKTPARPRWPSTPPCRSTAPLRVLSVCWAGFTCRAATTASRNCSMPCGKGTSRNKADTLSVGARCSSSAR